MNCSNLVSFQTEYDPNESDLINNLKMSKLMKIKTVILRARKPLISRHVKGENSTFTVRCYFNPFTQNGPPPREPETVLVSVTNLGCSGSFLEQIYASNKPG